MSIAVVRTAAAWYVVTAAGAVQVATAAVTTRELLADRVAVAAAVGAGAGPAVPVAELALVSPVTAPCRVVAQMTNYASHIRDSGMNPAHVPMTFFRKSSGSVCGPYDDVVRPAHVRFLDYEVEIGVVLGHDVPVGSAVTAASLPGLIAALVVTNDVSARDLQLPKTQFYESKSYPTFTPTGPFLVLLEPGDLDRFDELRLQLWVNGEPRQDSTVADMVFRPLETLQALVRFQHLEPGDLLLTGTPGGTALAAPAKPVELIGRFLPAHPEVEGVLRPPGRQPEVPEGRGRHRGEHLDPGRRAGARAAAHRGPAGRVTSTEGAATGDPLRTAAPWPVVVIGAGPVGVLAANLLGQQGVSCLLLDRWEEPYPQPRAVHLDDEVHRLLGWIGVADAFARISRPARGLRLLSPDHRVLAEFRRSAGPGVHGYPQANMFDQPQLEALLRERLSAWPSVLFRGGVEVTGVRVAGSGPVRVDYEDRHTGEGAHVLAEYVLGCDGANSLVAGALGVAMTDFGFAQRWLVVDVAATAELGAWEGVHQVCDRDRAATYMQIGPDRHRWEFRLAPEETAKDFEDLGRLLPLLAPWTGSAGPGDLQVLRLAEYEFRARVADRWRSGRLFLLGDAAHLTPPFIGQGMGAGLRDAGNLSWKLAGVLRRDLAPEALDSYEAERKPHVTALIRLAVLMGRAMTSGGSVAATLRVLAAPRLQLVPGLRAKVLDSATPRLARSGLVRRGRRTGSLPGRLCPNLAVGDDRRVDDLAPGRFLVVSAAPLTAAHSREVGRRGARSLVVAPHDPLGRWLRDGRAAAVVVRPDLTVLAAARSVAALLVHLPLFRPPAVSPADSALDAGNT